MARTPTPGTRERILDVASRLFYANGIRAVGMKQIIDEAGTGKNLLYRHFPAKDDLVAAYLDRARERRERAAAQTVRAAGDDPGDGLVALVREVGEQIRHPRFRGCAFRNYLVEFRAEAPSDHDPAVPAGDGPGTLARATLRGARARIDELARRVTGSHEAGDAADDEADDEAAVLAEGIWLIVDGLYLQAAYRSRADGDPTDPTGSDLTETVASAVALARRLVDEARPT